MESEKSPFGNDQEISTFAKSSGWKMDKGEMWT